MHHAEDETTDGQRFQVCEKLTTSRQSTFVRDELVRVLGVEGLPTTEELVVLSIGPLCSWPRGSIESHGDVRKRT